MSTHDKIIHHAKGARHVAGLPKRITPEIETFCAAINANAAPVYLPVTPTPDAQPAKCFRNVNEACQEAGGTLRFGWLIWEMPGVYLTAEHHAVVERDGRLIDVTPQVHGESRVLFLPVREGPEEPTYIPNRYMPLVQHELVLRAVRLMEENQRLFASGAFDTPQFRRNDEESARLLDEYFHVLQVRDDRAKKKLDRAKKKAARKRR